MMADDPLSQASIEDWVRRNGRCGPISTPDIRKLFKSGKAVRQWAKERGFRVETTKTVGTTFHRK